MATQVLEVDLSEKILPLVLEPGYDSCFVLLRFRSKPFGCLQLNGAGKIISPEQMLQEIRRHHSRKLIENWVSRHVGLDKTEASASVAISVVVCTRNRTEYLARCLEALFALKYPQYEILIIDNAPSTDDTQHLVQNMPVRYIREERPGLDWARNRGIAEAKYSVVAFTDDDARPDRFWLQAISRNFANPQVACVTGNVVPAELSTTAQEIFEFSYGGMGHGYYRKVNTRSKLSDNQLLWASSFGVGANMAFRKEVFQDIGLFDIALDVGTPSCGGGDIEMFHRLVAKGHVLVYEPEMLVWHSHRRDMAGLKKQIADNGRSFGCYLITCYKNRTVNRFEIIKFLLFNWLYKWIFKNIVRPPKGLPRYLVFSELAGMLQSPFAYLASKDRARKTSQEIYKNSAFVKDKNDAFGKKRHPTTSVAS